MSNVIKAKRKFKRMGMKHTAVESYLVYYRDRLIRIYQLPIPGFYGIMSNEILEIAAEKAYKKGWRKIVLTWGDMLSSYCFQDGYAWLLAMNISMANRPDNNYRTDHFLCEVDREGNVFKEPSGEDDQSQYEDQWDSAAYV